MKRNRVKEVQEFLHQKGIHVSEVAIVNAAITIATRYNGKYIFLREFKKQMEEAKNNEIVQK